ncbi:MAG: hypothetical protein KBF58_09360 [Methyloversatilis sp.]|jgi:hypothetical protein|nr:hypothetical protein [Methyloversatilis sp.]MBP6194820.1 hypothetical protein [Methyloversatilis sp.]MBP9118275.1 hypothetical protein [Methyloversatilis sp.]
MLIAQMSAAALSTNTDFDAILLVEREAFDRDGEAWLAAAVPCALIRTADTFAAEIRRGSRDQAFAVLRA